MQLLVWTAQVLIILTATVQAGEFLQPWTAGLNKDYSHNIDYAIGTSIITGWKADFTNATITLWQDGQTGGAQGFAVTLERESQFFTLTLRSSTS